MSELSASSEWSGRCLKVAGRLSGLTAVVLGGWSLWLAFSTVSTPDQIEARDERRDESAVESDDLPEVLRPTQRQAPPAAQITNIAVNSAERTPREVEPAGFTSANEATSHAVAVASFSTEASNESTESAAATTASAAWLTGEIEDVDVEGGTAAVPATGVRPWKRTTKSLKSTLRSPRSVPRR